jgi:SAM-dependent methyltransferase
LCCGTGYGTNLLLAADGIEAIGFDIGGDVIAAAQRRFPGPQFAVADVTSPLDLHCFDLRVCFEGIEHVADPEALLRNMSGALSIISTPNSDGESPSLNPHHLREFTLDEFRALLEPHFTSIRIYFQWGCTDPLDQAWSLRNALKAFVPMSIKRRLDPTPTTAGRGSAPTRVDALDFRPLPINYLSLFPPGLRWCTPDIWIAVCQP